MTSGVRHVLLDADGVMQHLPGGWVAAMAPYLGSEAAETFFHDLNIDELACLRGEADFLPLLAQRLLDYDVTRDVGAIFSEIWLRIHVDEDSIALVRRLRGAGLGVHLASNQEAHRAAYMLEDLGYSELFERCFVSHDVGAAKPSPDYFERVVTALDADPASVLFVDDLIENVETAREMGLRAECWHLDEGHRELATRLSGHGLDAGDFLS